ncbi:MAG: alpha/beta fold hydrolase [Myxococcota bacterium]
MNKQDDHGEKLDAVPREVRAEAPGWFREALATPYRVGKVEVQGCSLNVLHWGDPARPGLLLVHGGAAHAHWWSFLAPMLARHYYVVAPELSGHGESGRRVEYPRQLFADEVMAVLEASHFVGPPVLVGHSMGGMVAIIVASLYGEQLTGAVIVDAPVQRPDPESRASSRSNTFRKPGVYATYEEAMRHFRLVPDQPCENDYILEHIARHSLKQTEEGWTWKFDPRIFMNISSRTMSDYLASVKCRVALMRGEFSTVVPPETSEYMYEVLDRDAPLIEIPQSHHHLILDQPLAFISALRALLADWEHSLPRARRFQAVMGF